MTMLLAEKKDNCVLIGYGFNKLPGLKKIYILVCSINSLSKMLKSNKCYKKIFWIVYQNKHKSYP